MRYIITLIFILAMDQGLKLIISSTMAVYHSIPVIENYFHITYIQNTGAAFSLLEGQGLFLIIITLIFIVIGLLYLFRHIKENRRVLFFAITLMVGGGIGNLIDRIRLGYVVDMFDFRVFPVFNIADICVTIGCILFCYHIILIDGRKSARKAR